MCGIAGFWRFKGPRPDDGGRLARMADSIAHRGPNDFGYLLANSTSGQTSAGQNTAADFLPDVLLASRRLSITDLSTAGRQPMCNENEDTFVVFNGAIHNYVELRQQLEALGHVFRSRTDTEVIAHAYEQWGEQCARRFNGMWAYVIWDKRREQLVCSRDRFGIKPLVLAWRNGSFYFASEAKAIFSAGDVPAVANSAYLHRYLSHSLPVHVNQTPFAGLEQLAPGHNLVITRTGHRTHRYWSYGESSISYSYDTPQETFRELLADAVRLRSRSDVSVALLLSGGLDSSVLASLLRDQMQPDVVEAYTFCFARFKHDERADATEVARQFGLRHHCLEFDPSNLLNDIASVVWHMDAPPTGGQTLARWHLLRAASETATVVVEGQGADEMLGGYPEIYRQPYIQSEWNRLSLVNAPQTLLRIGRAHTGRSYQSASQSVQRQLRRLMNGTISGSNLEPRQRKSSILSQEFVASVESGEHTGYTTTYSEDAFAADGHRFADPLSQALHADHARQILPYLLHFGDALSMAHSVESRLPFLDHRLVEFVFGLPFDQKIRGSQRKYVARQAFKKQLPPPVRKRRNKVGFDTPTQQWLLSCSKNDLRERLSCRRGGERGIFKNEEIQRRLDQLKTGDSNATRSVFRCLAVESFFEQFIDRDWQQN